MMKKVHLLVLLFITHFAVTAQESGLITGKITEKEGNFSLPGATVKGLISLTLFIFCSLIIFIIYKKKIEFFYKLLNTKSGI